MKGLGMEKTNKKDIDIDLVNTSPLSSDIDMEMLVALEIWNMPHFLCHTLEHISKSLDMTHFCGTKLRFFPMSC